MPYTLSPIAAVEASGPGALPGFESRCSCGLVMRSSLRTVLEADRVAHAVWHERQARTNGRADDVAYVRERIAEAIGLAMRAGATYDDATAEAFAYCDRRWPTLTAAVIAEAA